MSYTVARVTYGRDGKVSIQLKKMFYITDDPTIWQAVGFYFWDLIKFNEV